MQSLSLQSLIIDSVGTLHVKFRMDTLTALEYLFLQCQELSFVEGVFLPPKLQSFEIWSERITSQPVMEWGFQRLTALSRLYIKMGDDIVNPLVKEPLLPISLVYLTIISNEMKSFDGNGLVHLSSLQRLRFHCRQLESVSENFLPSSLKSLEFRGCERLASLPENRLPSSLESLEFWGCKKLESLPEHCLPSSLKSLSFVRCERLESLPDESLPDSLEKLFISDCPLLEERYKMKEHWSKIDHIPFIKINDQLTI